MRHLHRKKEGVTERTTTHKEREKALLPSPALPCGHVQLFFRKRENERTHEKIVIVFFTRTTVEKIERQRMKRFNNLMINYRKTCLRLDPKGLWHPAGEGPRQPLAASGNPAELPELGFE